MITDTQIAMIKFELSGLSRAQIEREGVDKTIRKLLDRYHLEPTKKNYNSIRIIVDYKK